MAGLVYDLIRVLDDQKECYTGLVTLAKYKTDSIVDRDMENLEEVLKTEQNFVGRAARLEKNREIVLKDISNVLNMNYRTITISSLIDKLNKTPDEQKQLIKIREELLELAHELKHLNETNESLLTQSLEFIDFTLNALQSAHSYPGTGYKTKGKEEQKGVSFFDTKQ